MAFFMSFDEMIGTFLFSYLPGGTDHSAISPAIVMSSSSKTNGERVTRYTTATLPAGSGNYCLQSNVSWKNSFWGHQNYFKGEKVKSRKSKHVYFHDHFCSFSDFFRCRSLIPWSTIHKSNIPKHQIHSIIHFLVSMSIISSNNNKLIIISITLTQVI